MSKSDKTVEEFRAGDCDLRLTSSGNYYVEE